MKNATFENFGGEQNEFYSNEHWTVLVRPKQVSLGSSVLICKRPIDSMSKLTDAELLSFGIAIREIESRLLKAFEFEKINYLLLMMKDNEVHFHIIPRYSKIKEFAGLKWEDKEWPKAPDMTSVVTSDTAVLKSIKEKLA
ncbi:HIT family protein [Ferruginibacter sp.]